MSFQHRWFLLATLLTVVALRSDAADKPADQPADKNIFDFGNKQPQKSDPAAADRGKLDALSKEIDQAILRGDYDQAVKSATAAENASRALGDAALIATAAQRAADVRKLKDQADKALPAIAKLTQSPDDAGANVEAGRFLCFWRGDWEKGLPLLARGSDSSLRALAEEDLASGADVPLQFAVANAWWDLGGNLEGPPRAFARDRAAEIYLKIVARLEGFNHTTAQKRIAEAPVRLPFPRAVAAAQAAAGDPKAPIANSIQIVSDDFACDIYHNGKLIPAQQRKLQGELHGAQGELITVDLKPGDWIVFNVVNNRLRWGGAYYFAAAGLTDAGGLSFVSELRSGNWSACDDLKEIPKFIAERDYLADKKAQAVQNSWDKEDAHIRKANPEWNGQPIWGDPASRSTWLKYVVPSSAK